MPKPFFKHRSKGNQDWLFILPGIAVLGLFGLPIFALVLRATGPEIMLQIQSPMAQKALTLSLTSSLWAVTLSILSGTPLAYMLARWKFPGQGWLDTLLDIPVILPPSVAGLALLITFGRQGLLGPVLNIFHIQIPFTTLAVILAQTFVSAPLYIRAAKIGFGEIDPQVEEAAYMDGADEWNMFRHIMFPLAGRALLSGALLTWTRALGEFGATILFAGNLEGITQTMPLAIYLGFERNIGVAVALSTLLVAVSVVLLLVTRWLGKPEAE